MLESTLLTIGSAILGIGLAYTPLKNYQLFNIIMEFLGSGGFS